MVPIAAQSLQVRQWTDAEFASSRGIWQDLLAFSNADPLFMSWDWQWCWWNHHRRALRAKLCLLGVYSNGNELIGIAPFYSPSSMLREIAGTSRLEFNGIAWRNDRAVFSEYLDVVAIRERQNEIVCVLARWLKEHKLWQEMILPCTKAGSLLSQLATTLSEIALIRETDPMTAYCIELPSTFENYVANLQSGTRRRLFNHRAKLRDPQMILADADTISECVGLLRQFRRQRWHSHWRGDDTHAFELDFANRAVALGTLRMSKLLCDGHTVSVMFNIRLGLKEYYFQSGFDSDRSGGMSMGYLHFGYAIEHACRDGLTHFDLMAGRGLHRDYKADLGTTAVSMTSYHVVRAPLLLRRAYSIFDRLRSAR